MEFCGIVVMKSLCLGFRWSHDIYVPQASKWNLNFSWTDLWNGGSTKIAANFSKFIHSSKFNGVKRVQIFGFNNSFEKKVSLKHSNPIFLPLVRCLAWARMVFAMRLRSEAVHPKKKGGNHPCLVYKCDVWMAYPSVPCICTCGRTKFPTGMCCCSRAEQGLNLNGFIFSANLLF